MINSSIPKIGLYFQIMLATYEELKFEKFLRDREKEILVWKTKSNETIPITKLSDEHLNNILQFVNKKDKDSNTIKSNIFSFY